MLKIRQVEDILLFLTLLFLPTQLGKHFWPDFSYIYSLRIDYLSPTIYFWDLLVVALLVVWFLGRPKINKTALNIVLVFLFTQALSLISASNMGAGLVRLEQYFVSGFFGVFLSSQDWGNSVKKFFWPLSLALSLEATLAVLQFIKGGTLGLWVLGERTFDLSTPGVAKFDFYGSVFLRPYATFPHPNVLAGYLLITGVLLSSWKSLSVVKGSGMLKIAGALAGLTIFLTMSRTAILAGITAILLILKRKWLGWTIFMVLVFSPVLFIRFSSLTNFDNLAVMRREELIENSWEIFIDNPLFGVGLNNFIPALVGNLVTGPSRFLQPVHNIFFLALSETGIIGLIGLISLMGVPILKLLKLHPKPYTLIPVLPWFIIIFLGMFDHYFLTLPQGQRLFFLVWGLSFSMLKYPDGYNLQNI